MNGKKKQIILNVLFTVAVVVFILMFNHSVYAEESTIVYRGTDKDLEWSIDSDGHLKIWGEGDWMTGEWRQYKDQITTASVSVTGITSTLAMFYECSSLTSIDVSNFNTSQVTNMAMMFSGCSSLTSLDLRGFNTSQVTDMSAMFEDCSSLTDLNISSFKTNRVTDMAIMFRDCSSLSSIDVSNFNTSRLTDMEDMFSGCSSLTSIDVSNFNTSQVTNMSGMFGGCSSLTSIDVGNFNTSQVTDMARMFVGCSSLASIDVSNFNTSQVTNMAKMFSACSSLTSLDLSGFDTTKATDMANMYWDCSSLKTVKVCEFKAKSVSYHSDIFCGCTKLEKVIVTKDNIWLWELPAASTWYYQPTGKVVTTITKAGVYATTKADSLGAKFDTTEVTKGVKFIKNNIQYEIVAHTSSKHTVKVYKGTKNTATSIKIPKTVAYEGITFDVVSISKNAFKGYKKATKLIIGNKVTTIGESAFQNCTKLKTVSIGSAVTSIGKKAFYGCKALTSVSIPSKVKTIGESAFKGDSKITTINIYSKKLSKVGKSALSGIDKYAKIYVPDSKLSAYKKLLKNRGQKSTVKIVKQGETKYTGKSVIAIGNCEISYEKEFKYTGKAIKPKVTVTYNNSTLIKGTNYTVSYKNNTEPGNATIVIKGKGIYVGTVEKNFTIIEPYKYPTIEHDVVFVDQQEGKSNKTSYCGIASAAVVEWWRYKNGKGATYISDWDRYDYIENKESKLPLSTLLCKNMRKRNNKNNPTNANTNWGTIFGEGVIVKGSYSKNKNVYYKSSKFNNEELEKMYERLKNGPLIVHRDAGHYSVVYAYVGNKENLIRNQSKLV